MNKHIYIQSPTRVDLAGGTLDLWPLYNFFGGATTVNLAIDIFTFVELEVLSDSRTIHLESLDLKRSRSYTDHQQLLDDHDPDFALFRIVLEYFKPEFGLRLRTKSDSPVGGGLGGSSSLMISLLKAFAEATERPFHSVHKMVEVAHNLEAQLLLTPTGTQDYYPAVSGGINILEYAPHGTRQNLFTHKNVEEIESRFLLVYTGRSHHSGMNNFEVLQKAVARDAQTIRALSNLRVVAQEVGAKVRAGLWKDLASLFHREYEFRIQLAPAILSPEIKELHQLTLAAGAEAVKICGAGGGGCVLVWCTPGTKDSVSEVCRLRGFQVLGARPHPILEGK